MKFNQTHRLDFIADLIKCEFVGPADFPVTGMNEIHVVTPGDIVFVDHPKYYDKALNSAATIVLINKKVDCPDGKALLISDDPFRDFNKLTQHFVPFSAFAKANSTIATTALIHPTASLGNEVVVGENTVIHANVSIGDRCIIGDNVIIHAGTVLGGDAFYYKRREAGYDKLLSNGRVVIEDQVEIGALCTIDRGASGDTTIGYGSKLDNQVHIGHDTVLGRHVLIASQVGIAGCVIIEDNVKLWGQVGVRSDVKLGEGCEVMAQSGVSKDIQPGEAVFGSPAINAKEKFKELAALRMLPNLVKKL
ncbi:UDP-3-O-(3-hydroxymyristoyl)glucosamine N-acyltransferase [Nonlabens tegetincola]|uniref:UDP-3-O-(3-hydroxymyristoyl)glucosamine N-acyltransferase n=1 Tax=Nonlabens tegetincola TaxID=323273 RepID=UPI000CF4468A|nr:UDP-3-O-(3-hydroxymyristoyl)glucosamine N-acyltransferase [Nonlabens tegetincola]PQJ17095.1 UDP-3-O-(3-hydroxymyristoyl)glucosamine N-acyltransferase [Nonlabens tegetincola]